MELIEGSIETLSHSLDTLWDRLCKLERAVEDLREEHEALVEGVRYLHSQRIHDEPQVQQTTEEFVRVRHGKWEYDEETAGFKCTECGKRIYGMTLEIGSGDIKYCPNCGARMEDEDDIK